MGILLEELDLSARVVGQREDLVELDLRVHAVALDDAVEPRPAVEDLGVLAGLPLVDASGPAPLAPDEVLADQSLHALEPRRDLVKVLAAGGVVDMGRQLVANGGGDHLAVRGAGWGAVRASTEAAAFSTTVPLKKSGFTSPQKRTAFSNMKSRKSSS